MRFIPESGLFGEANGNRGTVRESIHHIRDLPAFSEPNDGSGAGL
jgi:hypothetical protein